MPTARPQTPHVLVLCNNWSAWTKAALYPLPLADPLAAWVIARFVGLRTAWEFLSWDPQLRNMAHMYCVALYRMQACAVACNMACCPFAHNSTRVWFAFSGMPYLRSRSRQPREAPPQPEVASLCYSYFSLPLAHIESHIAGGSALLSSCDARNSPIFYRRIIKHSFSFWTVVCGR